MKANEDGINRLMRDVLGAESVQYAMYQDSLLREKQERAKRNVSRMLSILLHESLN